MKRISVIVLLPLVLFALERVNLIKDHSFEKDSEVWHTRLVGWGFPDNMTVKVSRHDAGSAHSGDYSGSGDTREEPNNPPADFEDYAYLTQGFSVPKILEDIDSLSVNYKVLPLLNNFAKTWFSPILLHLDANNPDYWKVGYSLKPYDLTSGNNKPPLTYLEQITYKEDTSWHLLQKNIRNDIEERMQPPFSLQSTVDSIILSVVGDNSEPWRGQKVFFDDVRLMGYADYDVGVKEITSVTETIPYTPAALIKNFGREPADSFLVIAEITKDEVTHYADTVPWSLPSDMEDTVPFKTFIPPDTGTYLLRIYTVMDPDESDADDEKTMELHFEAIAEPVTHPVTHLSLNVDPFSMSGVLRVSYSLPKGHTGTLTLFDLSGRRVDAKQVRGYGSATFSSDVAAGVYIVRLEAGGTTLAQKVVIAQ